MNTYEIEIVRGDTWVGPGFRWKDSEGAVVPLEDARMQIRRSADAADAMVTLTVGDGIDLVDNTVWPTMTPEQTADLRDAVFDIEVVSESGQVKTLVEGPFTVSKDVTRV